MPPTLGAMASWAVPSPGPWSSGLQPLCPGALGTHHTCSCRDTCSEDPRVLHNSCLQTNPRSSESRRALGEETLRMPFQAGQSVPQGLFSARAPQSLRPADSADISDILHF